MSIYEPLWEYVKEQDKEFIKLTFGEIDAIAPIEIDHSFLDHLDEVLEYGYKVTKVSIQKQTVAFIKLS